MSRTIPAKNVRIVFEADTYEEDGDTFGLWIDTDSGHALTSAVAAHLARIPGVEKVHHGRYSAGLPFLVTDEEVARVIRAVSVPNNDPLENDTRFGSARRAVEESP